MNTGKITTVTIYARSYFVWCRSFYDFYKDQSLFEVLSAIGLSKLTYKLKLYVLSKVMDAFNEHGILEPLLQALLAPFYQSSKTLDIIEKHLSE